MLNLANIIDEVGKDKGIDKHILIEALETAMLKAAEKRFGPNKVIEAHYQEEMGEIELFLFKEVVEEAQDPDTQIEIEAAKELDPEVAIGDSLGVKLDSKEFGRIDAQTAKQIIIQKVREAERNIVYNEYSAKRGERDAGLARKFEPSGTVGGLHLAASADSRKEQVRRE